MEEILFNICDNAIKYNRDGGTLSVALRQYMDGVELTVQDTGIGIPPSSMDRLYDRFYRVDKSHSRDIGGTGLGLSIVKRCCEFIGARISVESQLEVGTTVRILFRRHRQEQ